MRFSACAFKDSGTHGRRGFCTLVHSLISYRSVWCADSSLRSICTVLLLSQYAGFYPVGGGQGGSFPPKHPNFSPKRSSFPPVCVACMHAVTTSCLFVYPRSLNKCTRLHLWQCKIQNFPCTAKKRWLF